MITAAVSTFDAAVQYGWYAHDGTIPCMCIKLCTVYETRSATRRREVKQSAYYIYIS